MADKNPNLTPEERALMREVSEDMRREQMALAWKKWRVWILAGLLLLVAVVGGIEFRRNWREKHLNKDGMAFSSAMVLVDERDIDAAVRSLEQIAARDKTGFAPLARVYAAVLRGTQGVEDLLKIAGDSDMPQVWRDFARVAALYQLIDARPAAELTEILAPLAAQKDSPWTGSIGELRALIALRADDTKAAAEALRGLVGNPQVSARQQDRAKKLLSELGQ
ncbi:hypothetical protein FACS1894186_3040 [Alphaproteobacteria bacterium]|nr:hypothetical protein FACS1894186_3040 [Alphaproteobacteria bacterium]